VWFVEYLFNRFKWYRKRKGGKWYYVIPRPYPYIELWVQNPKYWEHICYTEEW
jgi:hypothetical protein